MDISEFVRLRESRTEGPPTVWVTPYYGNGLLTTGNGLGGDSLSNCGEKYGYCYLPQLHIPSASVGMASPSALTSLGAYTGPERIKISLKNYAESHCHPYFATREEAVAWIKDVQKQVANFTDADREFYNFPHKTIGGDVLRYAHHCPLEERVPTKKWNSFSSRYEWQQYRPWITAGITDKVLAEPDWMYGGILGNADDLTLHMPDGTNRPL